LCCIIVLYCIVCYRVRWLVNVLSALFGLLEHSVTYWNIL
jgi:hypothetical protein